MTQPQFATTKTSTGKSKSSPVAGIKLPYLVLAWSGHAALDAHLGPRLFTLCDGLVLGRSTGEEEPRLALDPKLSREHVRFKKYGGEWTIEDLGSRNGTVVDGKTIYSPTALKEGSIIFTGSQVFVLRNLNAEQIAVLRNECGRPTTGTPTFSIAAAHTYQKVKRLADADLDLFISGETGTGKEVLARAVHMLSGRKGSFVALNCAALPEPLVESELFGFRRGAHSAAREHKLGLLELARDGTLFLDELGESSFGVQAKLLRFLQDRSFTPLGGTAPVKVNTRIIGASHRRNLAVGNDGRGLRPDLANRLGPEPIVLPPLRERIEDVGVLAALFLAPLGKTLSNEAVRCLFLSSWEGNIRQLWHRIRYAAASVGDGQVIQAENLPAGWTDPGERKVAVESLENSRSTGSLRESPSAQEIEAILRKTGGDVAAAARELGRQRTLVWKWLRRFGIDPTAFRVDKP
ncbi:MAG: sigma 54-interacting transcriptional regulator [Deltaproteobacteria bacterium]|nr:sigma 54-interacting transcriptional regulator [Deltaproteobacteria bacterium]